MAYSDAKRVSTLIILARNKNDFERTAKEAGVSPTTLKRWATEKGPNKSIADLLDEALTRMFEYMPAKWEAKDWSIALGIMFDKWLLMQGEATERTEHIGDYRLTEPEKELVGQRARAIISGFGDGSAGSGSDNGADTA